METLSPEEMRKTLEYLSQLAVCPVCLETLTSKVALCARGHAVCQGCLEQLKQLHKSECPQCKAAFCQNQPICFISQVIECLPHTCRHKKCDFFVRTEDDHEKFCNFKLTKCRHCDWSGPENELVRHIQSKHTTINKYLIPLLGNVEKGIPFDPKIKRSVFTPIYVEGHFFWGEMKNEPNIEKLTAVFHPVGNGKVDIEFKGSVKLSLKGSSYSADVKLNMDPDKDPYAENCISIPTSIIHKYTVDNKLQYTLTVEVTMLESLVTWVQSRIKSGIGFIKSYRQ
ncbi:E3 ubiquitin-protein ligase Siah2-like [Macrosteles quadrilineatus]|uniref:E3 ubiquitin-protein ligase Siah2-like n=1 Tax=Macrosteles quadrilineatus TaxID=74068 RepID=UPI0023E2CE0E|nr:E3 ubiquitin-protein ligase Siah2-like [Macrosteles quadrilineatus]